MARGVGLHFASVRAFLDWNESQSERYELVRGTPTMHPGTNRGHERIAKRVFRELIAQVDSEIFDVNKSDFALETGVGDYNEPVVRYPDIVIDRQTGNDDDRIAISPVVVIEVLSRSTGKIDTTIKAEEYGSVATIKTYIVFDREKPIARVWRRARDGAWPTEPLEIGADELIELPEVGAVIEMGRIYDSRRRPVQGPIRDS